MQDIKSEVSITLNYELPQSQICGKHKTCAESRSRVNRSRKRFVHCNT